MNLLTITTTANVLLRNNPERLRPLLENALLLPPRKLAKAEVEQRLFLLEKRITDSDSEILELALMIAEQRRAWTKVDWLALANTRAFESEQRANPTWKNKRALMWLPPKRPTPCAPMTATGAILSAGVASKGETHCRRSQKRWRCI